MEHQTTGKIESRSYSSNQGAGRSLMLRLQGKSQKLLTESLVSYKIKKKKKSDFSFATLEAKRKPDKHKRSHIKLSRMGRIKLTLGHTKI